MSENININLVIKNLKEVLNISTDVELARMLGFKRSTFSQRKKTNSIPYEEIINLCVEKNILLDKIFRDNDTINSSGFLNSETINLNEYNDEKEIKEVIKLLRFAPKQFLYKLKKRLKEMEKLIDDF